jgi:hypothetical protein
MAAFLPTLLLPTLRPPTPDETLRATRSIHVGIRTGLIFAIWNSKVRAACLNPDADFLVAHYRLAGFSSGCWWKRLLSPTIPGRLSRSARNCRHRQVYSPIDPLPVACYARQNVSE